MNGIKSIREALQRAVGRWETAGEDGATSPGSFRVEGVFRRRGRDSALMRASDGREQNAGWYRETSPLLPASWRAAGVLCF